MPLTDKQQVFIDLYVIPGPDGSLNATQAYRRAYPKCKSDEAAASAAARLLGNVKVREEVDKRLAKFAEETGMSAKEAFAVIAAIARGNVRRFLDTTGAEPKMLPANLISDAAWASAESIKVKRFVEDDREGQIIEYRLESRLPACVVILKAHGALTEKVEHTGKDGKELFPSVRIFLPDNGRSLIDAAANGEAHAEAQGAAPPDAAGR